VGFVNEPLTHTNWPIMLQEIERWQLGNLGVDTDNESSIVPPINGSGATYDRALKLQSSLRKDLTSLTTLCRRPPRFFEVCEGAKPWTWRKAQVLPTRQMFFDDAGEALGFLAEALEFEIRWCLEAAVWSDKGQLSDWVKRQQSFPGNGLEYRRQIKVLLHLAICECGCQRFFLWEGNWRQRERKFLNDKHRMNFHNSRNVTRKKNLARQRRSEGRYQ
jgi:hypothetical protein